MNWLQYQARTAQVHERWLSFILFEGHLHFHHGHHEEFLMKAFGIERMYSRHFSYFFPRGAIDEDVYNGRVYIGASKELQSYQSDIVEQVRDFSSYRIEMDFNDPHYVVKKETPDWLESMSENLIGLSYTKRSDLQLFLSC